MKLIVAIPAFNEEKTICDVIDLIPSTINQISSIKILVIDDGSKDKTAKIAISKGAMVIKHKNNKGVGKSFQDALDKSIELRADILVTIDADNQFNPKEIPRLIQPILNNEADFVTGSRFVDQTYTPEEMPWIKRWGNKRIAGIISFATGQKFHDVSCGFRAYNRDAMLKLNLFGKFTYTQETFLDLAYKGLHISEVPVTVKYFENRISRVAHSIPLYAYKSAKIMFRTIKDYRPLKFFGLCGFILMLAGLGLGIFVFIHFLKYNTFSPYKIVGFLSAFLCAVGIMIIFIGILADLIDKVRLTQEKILYYEKKRTYDKE